MPSKGTVLTGARTGKRVTVVTIWEKSYFGKPSLRDMIVCFTFLFIFLFSYSIGGMAILYVLEIKEDDLSGEDSENIQASNGTIVSSFGLNDSKNFTTLEPQVGTAKPTLGPRKTNTSSSSSDVTLPTKHSRTQHITDQRSIVTPRNLFSRKSTPTAKGNLSVFMSFWGSRINLFSANLVKKELRESYKPIK